MLSNDIERHYHIYKHGVDQLARWLLSTAAYCDSSQTRDSSATIPTARLLQLAEFIASHRRPAQIPDEILELIEEVIDARENCANFYTSQGLQCSGHRHYLQILQQVREVLKQAKRRNSAVMSCRPDISRCTSSSSTSRQADEQEVLSSTASFPEPVRAPIGEWTVVPPKSHERSTRLL